MHFLLFFLVILCSRPSDAVTLTRINYLPDGQVGAYELIINNTVQPRINSPLSRDRVSEIVKHTNKFSNAFARVDQQVIGENFYLNLHRALQQQQPVRMKYPLKNVLMIPSVRYVNGVPENVKLRFAQIGPYAALIVPTESLTNSESPSSVPPEIRDIVKAYIEVQEMSPSLMQSNQKTKTGYPYASPSYKSPSSTGSISPETVPSVYPQQPQKTGNYIYPEASVYPQQPQKTGNSIYPEASAYPHQPQKTKNYIYPEASVYPQQPQKTGNYIYPEASVNPQQHQKTRNNVFYPEEIIHTTPKSGPSEIGNPSDNGFVIRVVNPAKGDPNIQQGSGNKYKEFFVPAKSDEIDREENDKIIANPLKYSGSTDSSTSQFGEVYNKNEPPSSSSTLSDSLSDRTNDESPTNQSPESAADLKEPAATTNEQTGSYDLGANSGHVEAGKQVDQVDDSQKIHFQSHWSLVETRDPEIGYNPFERPPPGQTEVSVPPEIRESVKAYSKVQEISPSLAQSSQKTKTSYAYPPTYKSPFSTGSSSPYTAPSAYPQQPQKTGDYVYPEEISHSNPKSGSSEIGNDNGIDIRVANPAKDDANSNESGIKYQEFIIPAKSDKIDRERNDKMIENPFKYSGSTDSSTSQFGHTVQFGEAYKNEPSFNSPTSSKPLSYRISDELPMKQTPEPAADVKEPAAIKNEQTGSYDLGANSGHVEAGNQVDQADGLQKGHFQSGSSLVETQDSKFGYIPFEGPPPGQPEFSDVSPDSNQPSFNSSTSLNPLSYRTNDEQPMNQLPESAADLKEPAATTNQQIGSYDLGANSGHLEDGKQFDQADDSRKGNFQSGWSLVETQDSELGYNPFESPPPGQPEFSDVSADSNQENSQSRKSGLETNAWFPESSRLDSPEFSTTNQPFNSPLGTAQEGGQTSDVMATNAASVDPKLKKLGPAHDAKVIPKLNLGEASSTQRPFDQFQDFKVRDHANSAHTLKTIGSIHQFQGTPDENKEQLLNEGPELTYFIDKIPQTEGEQSPRFSFSKSAEAAVDSAQTSGWTQENKVGIFPNVNPTTSSRSGLESEEFQGTSSDDVRQISNDGTDTSEQFTRFQGTTKPGFGQLPNYRFASADQFQGPIVKIYAPSSAAAATDSAQRFGTTAQNMNDANFNVFQENILFGRFHGNAEENIGQFTYDTSTPASSGSDQKLKQFQGTSAENGRQISSDDLAAAVVHSASQPNQFQLTTGQNSEQLKQFLSQKEGQVSNAQNRNIALASTDSSGNHPLFDNEKFKKFIQDPSLTTQLNFLSPSGQTAAVLTSTGNSAKVELPSTASQIGHNKGNIVIPKTVIPLPISVGTPIEYKDSGYLLNADYSQSGTPIPLVRHRYNSFDDLRNLQSDSTGSSLNLVNSQQSNVFGSTAEGFRPVSNFNYNSAAAAAAAAVASDNEHFTQFDTTSNEFGSAAVGFDPSSAAAVAAAAVTADNEHFSRFAPATLPDTNQISTLDSANLTYPRFETFAKSGGERGPIADRFSIAAAPEANSTANNSQ